MTRGRKASRLLLRVVITLSLFAFARPGVARAEEPAPRRAVFEWDSSKKELYVSFAFRESMDDEVQKKLSTGLPTTIVFTGTLYRRGSTAPISTAVQSCKVTFHVWQEAYRVDLTRPEGEKTRWTTTLEGVLRRCAEVNRLLIATSKEVSFGTPVYLRGRVMVNPISQEFLDKIKQWVSRPARTGTAAPGDALFSTFTGLFMQRVGDAERILELVTYEILPILGGAVKNET